MIEWTKDYRDSKVWLWGDITESLSVRMSSWGSNFGEVAGRYAVLKSWTGELVTDNGRCILMWYTADLKRDVTDEEAKDISVKQVSDWLRRQTDDLRKRTA